MTELDARSVRVAEPVVASGSAPGFAEAVHRELVTYLGHRRVEAEAVSPQFATAVDVLTRLVVDGGKRLRPTFAWWGWVGACADGSGELPDGHRQVQRAVSALELLQACALVHDDLIDDSGTRRGAPTVHVEFAAQHREHDWLGGAERFGSAAAILLGDIALAWADDMLHDSGLDPAALQRAAPVWRSMRTEVLGGQYLDVLAQASGDTTAEAALRVSRFKTAAYTVERPLHLGAAIAGAGPSLVTAYRRFGADIGIAFQLRDDLLGVFGDPEVTGKPAGEDLREGKRTLLMALGAERARAAGDRAALARFAAAMGDAALDEDTVESVRGTLIRLGAVDEVERRIDDLTSSALDTLARAPVAPAAQARLGELAIRATRRDH